MVGGGGGVFFDPAGRVLEVGETVGRVVVVGYEDVVVLGFGGMVRVVVFL